MKTIAFLLIGLTVASAAYAAGPVTSNRPMARPTGAAWDAMVRRSGSNSHYNTRTGLIPWTPSLKNGGTDPNTGAYYQEGGR
jgi:hypothetical protein